ncbi:ferrous iron transport protein B [Rubellicoccus peritrichatus]|uniref:Ferrous iron transport protein B n=1 Tax=Rubellicoccus peritrichatus TaxID=3080537 RepID=A0AAQ3QQI8_9BACT|nr:ferrous iron transport protein B [Puniceicoccus sp. CR14]WOO40298.1 ferrous iron transport protein B [Puniceicoccus sp. CR14]
MTTATAEVAAPARPLQIALIGNPNTGKTSLFNSMTGLRQRVGNYPGVTVEKKVGMLFLPSGPANLVDLPGTYSLSATSLDERVVIDVLSGHAAGMPKPDVVICVVDATNLRRNLFLASQIADLDLPMVIALNVWDSAVKQGINIDVDALSKRLGVPVIPTVARKGTGVKSLPAAIADAVDNQRKMVKIEWPEAVSNSVEEIRDAIGDSADVSLTDVEIRRMVFDADSAVLRHLDQVNPGVRKAIEKAREVLRQLGLNPMAAEAVLHYKHLEQLVEGVIRQQGETDAGATESIDRILIHRGWGLVVFLAMMYLVFQSVYSWAGPFMDLIDTAKGWVQGIVGGWFDSTPMLQSLVTDGLIEGVGAFVIFLPQILILFFFIALLEDTGYMARAAFLMDKLLSWCGLNGKSFVPMLSSYACAIPGILATRTIEDPKTRLATILIAPFMSCSARLPVYILLIGAFIEPRYGPWVAGFTLFVMHFVGLAVAIPIAWILTRFVLKSKAQPFVMEMPPYRIPRLRDVVWRMWAGAQEFITRAGTIILAITVIVWALLYFPRPPELAETVTAEFIAEAASANELSPTLIAMELDDPDSELATELGHRVDSAYINQSYMGRMGKAIQPIFAPAGFDWKITVGVLASFPAREVIISTLGVIYSLGGDVDEESGDLRQTIANAHWTEGPLIGKPIFTIPVVLAIMVFFALCQQCGATVAVIAKESSWAWAIGSFIGMTILAWIGAVIVYQVGSLFG